MFGITLRLELAITDKTIKRYVTEAWKATKAAGIAPNHPKLLVYFRSCTAWGDQKDLRQNLEPTIVVSGGATLRHGGSE